MVNLRIVIFTLTIIYSCLNHATKTITIVGPPGAGKGTQTVMLREAMGWPLISPSCMLRQESLQKSVLAEIFERYPENMEVKEIVRLGVITRRLVQLAQEKNQDPEGIILDSWPKYPLAFDLAKIALFNQDRPLIIELVVDPKKLIDRAIVRKVCPNSACNRTFGLGASPLPGDICDACHTPLFKRGGDNKDHFPSRIEKYYAIREKLYETALKHGFTIKTVNGDQSVEQVHKDIMKLVEEHMR